LRLKTLEKAIFGPDGFPIIDIDNEELIEIAKQVIGDSVSPVIKDFKEVMADDEEVQPQDEFHTPEMSLESSIIHSNESDQRR
jgi:hypothetical protein